MNRTDIERLSNMEVEIKNIDKKISEHYLSQKEDFDKLYFKIDALNNNFAGKWTEKVLIGLASIFLTSIVSLVIILL